MVNISKSLIEKLNHLACHYRNRSNELNRSVDGREAYATAAAELTHVISIIEGELMQAQLEGIHSSLNEYKQHTNALNESMRQVED